MRGVYQVTDEDRRRFFHSLLELCKPKVDSVDLISTQLSLSNCTDLLEELGYEQDSWECHGWEGEIYCRFSHRSAPEISFSAEAYNGDLSMWWTDVDNGGEVDEEKLKEVMREKWGKYFPVI